MKLLLDTNALLDVMLDRKPFVADSAKVVAAAETGCFEGSLCATTITTIHYLASKALGAKAAASEISALLQIFRIAPVIEAVLKAALQIKGRDYEDLVLLEAARGIGIPARNGLWKSAPWRKERTSIGNHIHKQLPPPKGH
ncbi:MAG: PIN domain-containing protein [Verrucomicrobia bacterium]|nr:PIN domain-containing protein [Verrucomicrobiota bacterium]